MARLYKFDSGLTILYEKNNINKSTSIEICFDCGARCDGDLPGLSHFCEHMFFTGTNTLSKQEVTKRYFDFVKVNAYTSYADIVFTGTIVTSKLADYLRAVQDMICNSPFKKEAIDEEKKVVIQEIVRDADQHARHASRGFKYELYKLDCFKYGILGSKESVSKITSADVKKYVKKYFVKNNCYISICSPLSFNKIKSLVRKNFEQKLPSNKLKPLPYEEDRLTDCNSVDLVSRDIDKNFFSIAFKDLKKGADLKHRVVMNIIGNMIDDISDGLTKELRIDNSLIYSMSADSTINKQNSYLALFTEVSSPNIKPCLDIIINYIKNIVTNGFSQEQFAKELEQDEYYWQTRVDTPNNIRDDLTRQRLYGKFVSDKDMHIMVQQLTLDEVNNVARELFTSAQIQVYVYGNADKKDMYTIKQIQKKFQS